MLSKAHKIEILALNVGMYTVTCTCIWSLDCSQSPQLLQPIAWWLCLTENNSNIAWPHLEWSVIPFSCTLHYWSLQCKRLLASSTSRPVATRSGLWQNFHLKKAATLQLCDCERLGWRLTLIHVEEFLFVFSFGQSWALIDSCLSWEGLRFGKRQ